MNRINLFLIATVLCLFYSCSDDPTPDPEPGTPTLPDKLTVTGKVEKGPFVAGSSIVFYVLDDQMNPTGTSFPAKVSSDDGSYVLEDIHFDSPYVLVSASGYYYDEIYGEVLKKSTFTLSAIADLTEGATVNVNVWTHIKKERVVQLVNKEEKTFREASDQAQKELLTNFGLQRYAENEASSLSLTDGSEAGSALLVVSATLLEWCLDDAAELTRQMSNLAAQLKEKGEFTQEIREELREESLRINWERVAEDITEYYADLGKQLSLQDLNYFVDWDGDGIAGNELGTPGTEGQLAFETEVLRVPKEGGTFRVKVQANVPYKFYTPPSISYPTYTDIGIRDIEFTYSLDSTTQEVIVEVEPASALMMDYGLITISTYDENVDATLKIEQEGDYDKELPSDEVKMVYYEAWSATSLGLDLSTLAEAVYSQSFLLSGDWNNLYSHQIFPSDNFVYTIWFANYTALNRIRGIKDALAQQTEQLLPQLAMSLQEAMIYYALGVLWENVPYPERGYDRIPQLSVEELFGVYESVLLESRDAFPSQKNNNVFFVSRDLPTALLARMYMHTGDYAKAFVLWEELVAGNNYQLESSWEKMLTAGSREMIYSYDTTLESQYASNVYDGGVIPAITYGEVVISAAEAAYRIGNTAQALSYLNQLRTARGLTQVTVADLEQQLTATWKQELKGTLSYFAYLKRTGNISEVLPDNRLLPIPEREMIFSPGLIQNPGY